MSGVIAFILTLGLLAVVLSAAIRRVRTADLYGISHRDACRHFRDLQRASDMWWVLSGVAVVAGQICLLLAPAIGLLGRLEVLGVALVAILVALVLTVLRPPAVLFLASSRDDSRHLFHHLVRSVSFRVVTLLDPDADPWRRLIYYANGLRTRETAAWRAVVERLAAVVPLIVLDARHATPLVAHEVDHLFRNGLDAKTMFICRDDGLAPALDPIDPIRASNLTMIKSADAVRLVRERLHQHAAARPDPAFGSLRESIRLGLMGGAAASAGYVFATVALFTLEVPTLDSYVGNDQGRIAIGVPWIAHLLTAGLMPLLGIALSRVAQGDWRIGAFIPWAAVVVPILIGLAFGRWIPWPEYTYLLLTYAGIGGLLGLLARRSALLLAGLSVIAFVIATEVTLVADLQIRPLIYELTSSTLTVAVATEAFSQFLIWSIYGALMGAAIWSFAIRKWTRLSLS